MKPRFPSDRPQRRAFSPGAVVSLLVLLVLPTLAILRLARSVDARIIGGYVLGVSGITLWLYWRDKRRAQADEWRTPESTLHFAELLGGWPAAFIAQRAFRHKISKIRYQSAFWMIVVLHQVVLFDFLNDWHYSRAALSLLRQLVS
jgi:uncharacterized membrane protein YsdA (DUF1294 family)